MARIRGIMKKEAEIARCYERSHIWALLGQRLPQHSCEPLHFHKVALALAIDNGPSYALAQYT